MKTLRVYRTNAQLFLTAGRRSIKIRVYGYQRRHSTKSSLENIAARYTALPIPEQPRFIKRFRAWLRLKPKHPAETLNHHLPRLFSLKAPRRATSTARILPLIPFSPGRCASVHRSPPSAARFIKRATSLDVRYLRPKTKHALPSCVAALTLPRLVSARTRSTLWLLLAPKGAW